MNAIAPLWFMFLAVMAYLYERETHWFSRFNLFTVFVVGMLLRFGIAIPFSDNVNVQRTGISVTTTQLIEYYVAAAMAWIVVFVTVFTLQRLPSRSSATSSIAFRASRRPGWVATPVAVVAALLLTSFVALVTIVIPWAEFSQGFNKILASTHTASDYNQHRIAYGNAVTYFRSALNYAGSFASHALMPAVLLILFLQRSRSAAIKVALAAGVVVLALVGFGSGQKSAALLVVLSFVVASVVANGSHSIFTWRVGIAAIVLIVAIVPLLYHLQYPSQSYGQLLANTFYRETIEYSRSAQLRFVFYPDRHPFLLGLSSFVLRTIVQLAQGNTSNFESPENYIPTHSPGNAGYQSSWNGGFFAEGWADYGWVGVVGTSIVVGLVLVGIEKWFRSGPKGPLQLGTYAAICTASFSITDVSLTTALWSLGTLTAFGVYWIFRLFPADPAGEAEPTSLNASSSKRGWNSTLAPETRTST